MDRSDMTDSVRYRKKDDEENQNNEVTRKNCFTKHLLPDTRSVDFG